MVDPDGPGPAPMVPVTYTPVSTMMAEAQPAQVDVFDPSLRTISNLIVDQTLGNPAAILKGWSAAASSTPAWPTSPLRCRSSAAFKPASTPSIRVVWRPERADAAAQRRRRFHPSR